MALTPQNQTFKEDSAHPDCMATPAQIQAALASARAGALSWGEKALLLSVAIDNALVNGSGEVEMPIEIGGTDGTNWSRLKISEATALLSKWNNLDNGGITSQYVEFRETCR